MTQIKDKIAFKLSTPEAVEYANAHSKNGAGRYELCNDQYFHLPHFDVYDGLYGHSAFTIEPGYTDVTPNFLEDYYRPWKDKLASVPNDSSDFATLHSTKGNSDEQERMWAVRTKWAARLATMKDNRAKDLDSMSDAESFCTTR
jgi:hypothetical protein